MENYAYETRWGTGCLVVRGGLLVAVSMPGTKLPPDVQPIANATPAIREIGELLDDYTRGERVERFLDEDQLADALTEAGVTGFRHKALMTLADVPFGMTVSYGQLADLAGNPGAARAAGSACANNPLPLVVPCHRVLPASGLLGAFGGLGPSFKQRLLKLEGITARA